MATQFDDVKVQCPFYIARKDKDIRCEGVEDDSTTVLNFSRKIDAKDYKCGHCDTDYHKCRIYRMLADKYK